MSKGTLTNYKIETLLQAASKYNKNSSYLIQHPFCVLQCSKWCVISVCGSTAASTRPSSFAVQSLRTKRKLRFIWAMSSLYSALKVKRGPTVTFKPRSCKNYPGMMAKLATCPNSHERLFFFILCAEMWKGRSLR